MASIEIADDEVASAAEFEATIDEWANSRPKRQNRMAEERKATQTKAERSRRSDKGETRSSAINIRTTPAKKAKLDKASKAAKLTSTQFLEEAIDLKSALDLAAREHGTTAQALLDEVLATLVKAKKGRG